MEDPHVSWQIASKWWIFHGNASSQECNKSVPGGMKLMCGLELQTTVDGLEIRLTSFLVGIPFFTRFFFTCQVVIFFAINSRIWIG